MKAARGDKAEARKFYERFITLCSNADPEFRPMVERARKAISP